MRFLALVLFFNRPFVLWRKKVFAKRVHPSLMIFRPFAIRAEPAFEFERESGQLFPLLFGTIAQHSHVLNGAQARKRSLASADFSEFACATD